MTEKTPYNPFKKSHRCQLPGDKWQIIYTLVQNDIKLTAGRVDAGTAKASDEYWLQRLMALKNDLDAVFFRDIGVE